MTNKKYENMKEYALVILGSVLLAVGVKFYIEPNNFIIGGLSGLVLVILNFFKLEGNVFLFDIVYNITNAALVFMGLLYFGKKLMLKTVVSSLSVLASSFLITHLLRNGILTEFVVKGDLVLVTIFTSITVGLGVGLVLKQGGTTGGVDIPQKMISKIFNIPYSVAIYLIDGSILILGISFFGIEKGMYAIVSMYMIGKVVDATLLGINNTISIHVISKESDTLIPLIYSKIKRGITIVEAKGGYSKEKIDMLVVACYKKDYYQVRHTVLDIDPDAFIYSTIVSAIDGEGFRE